MCVCIYFGSEVFFSSFLRSVAMYTRSDCMSDAVEFPRTVRLGVGNGNFAAVRRACRLT